ncbi:hypothetical protein ECZU01_24350 [Escherichia coli]|nr:hypothetical protein ECZU01_24350 [Escherichia coli]
MKRGFTLLEVMLALAIFALAATAVLQIASGALSNQQILEEKTVAGWVAENQTALLPDDPRAAGGQAAGRERYGRKPLVLANHTAEYRQRAAPGGGY